MARAHPHYFDFMSSGSESELYDDITPRRREAHAITPRLSVRRSREQRKRLRKSSSSSVLGHNLAQSSRTEYLHSEEEDDDRQDSLPLKSRITTKDGNAKTASPKGPPLSDPNSWVWKGREDAKFAIVIESSRGREKGTTVPSSSMKERVNVAHQDSDVVPGKPKGRLWLHSVEMPLASSRERKLSSRMSLKQTSIDAFFGSSDMSAGSAARSAPSCAGKLSHGSKIATEKMTSRLHKSTSPSTIAEDGALSNNSGQDSDDPVQSTWPTSVATTPEPLINKERRLVSRTARRKLPASLLATFPSDSEDGLSSGSVYTSENEQNSASESATPTISSDDFDDSSASENGSDVNIPSTKRAKTTARLRAPKHTDTSGASSEPEDGSNEAAKNPKGSNVAIDASSKKSNNKKKAKDFEYRDTFNYRLGIAEDKKPISKSAEIFADMTEKALDLGLDRFVKHLNGRKLKVATMCSGTESPILALQEVSDALKKCGLNFEIDHLFSAEIVPFKQAYIERNFRPPIIYRDIRELSIKDAVDATTAYGGRAKIPKDVDLLVAGFSCVDFSALNNWKKDLNAGGESGDTLLAILNYAARYRPKIILLENVCGAPWDTICKKFRGIGYAADFLRVDTKDYYIPHTRERVYAICIESGSYHDPSEKMDGAKKASKIPKPAEVMVSTWKGKMKSFRRAASCSVEAFLLEEDDPRIIRSRDELANSGRGNSRRTKEIDWARCHGRHQDYRAALTLGQKRPLMKWEEGGSCTPPDYMWQDWAPGQVERVLDVIDIAWLRNLSRGFDHQFKFRLLDLSQNVDCRLLDTMASGLSGCITPSGIPFSTLRGGPIIGLEALALQGLPIDKLQLTREKQTQLQDLAGNAMSTTVVGAAALSCLIVAHTTLPPGPNEAMDTDTPIRLSHLCGEQNLIPFNLNLNSYNPLSVAKALDAAAKSFRLCLCEGRAMVTTTPLQQCKWCKHTTCVKCGANPTHHYVHLKCERIPPAEFGAMIKSAIPMKVTFAGVADKDIKELGLTDYKNLDSKAWDVSINAVLSALSSELRFHSTKRSEIWTVYYEAEHASMELTISSSKVEWRLFAKPPPSEPANSKIRRLLSRPIARMRPTGADLAEGSWQLWLPKVYEFDASFKGHGGLTHCFEDVQGIGKFADIMVWTKYSISIPGEASKHLDADITGTYELRQNCGTASGSLHVQSKTATSLTPLFLFLDPDRIYHPEDDFFVFSTDKRRLNYGETRPRIARVDPLWRPQKLEKVEDLSSGFVKYSVNGSKNLVTESEAQSPVTVNCYVDGQWVDLPNARFESSGADKGVKFRRAPSTMSITPSLTSCRDASIVLSCQATFPKGEVSTWQRDDWLEISPIDQKEFFADFAWMTEKACILPGLNDWRDVTTTNSISCKTCAPASPSIKWKLETPKTSKKPATVKKLQTLKLAAFEDPEQAAEYEHALKNRPSPLVTQIYIDNTGLIELKMAANPGTLMHRASAKLPPSLDNVDVTLSWRLVTNYFAPAKLLLPEFSLMNNNSNACAAKPPGFLIDLRPEQQKSLDWMIRQEDDGIEPFIEEEVEEAVIPQIGWRLEGRATKPVQVRGGVLADQVGYGKTVTTLALIDSQRERDRENAKQSIEGRIPLKATLILVPPQLPEQWHREIKKFLNKTRGYNVLVIKMVAMLQRMTVAQFQTADIIIASWKLCEGDSYLFKIAQFAGVVELPEKTTGRATAVWFEHALEGIAEHVDELKRGGKGLYDKIAVKLSKDEEKAAAAETFVPSKRLRGRAYQKSKQTPATGSKRTHAQALSENPDEVSEGSGVDEGVYIEAPKARTDIFGLKAIGTKKDWTSMTCPLLELFEFSRIVVDEYTYVTGQESLTIPKLKAKSRWILSATPPLQDFADVKCISKFLGINLGVDDLTPGVIKAANIKALEKEKTECEHFQSYQENRSAAWHERRHGVAQRFLDKFVRQNIADIETIKGSTHIIPIELTAAERASYSELEQLLRSNDFQIKKGKTNGDNDRTRRIQELLGQSESAEEALMKRASHFTLDDLDVKLENAPEACEVIVRVRREQYSSLKADFQKKLKQAEWLKKECKEKPHHYSKWKEHVRNNQFGDLESTKDIKTMIRTAEHSYKINDWIEFYVTADEKARLENEAESAKPEKSAKLDTRRLKPAGMHSKGRVEAAAHALRDVTNDLRKLSTELVSRLRGLRFFQFVREIQKLNTSLGNNGCSCLKCGLAGLSPEMVSILPLCGHVLCNKCLETPENRQDECLVDGCKAVKSYQVIKATELGVEDDSTGTGCHYGKKLETIVSLIKQIPEDDQVLLFVQFLDLTKKIIAAFNDNDITYTALGDRADASKKLTEFQNNVGSEKKKVLVLNIGDASAAGSNLTNANHIIFVSPYLTDRKQTYDQAMTQAIGRARRYGQLKKVHIYHFLSLKTIDVDIMESRSSNILVKGVAPSPEESFVNSFNPSSFGLIKARQGVKGEYGTMGTGQLLFDSNDE